jgi:hypothetical protein
MSFTRKDELGTTDPSIAGLLKKFRANKARENNARDDARDDDGSTDFFTA